MMKFFRKHNKELLAVFMVLLMVVFLGGSALSSLLSPDLNRVVATTRVGDISFVDQDSANTTTQFLASMGLNWQAPAPGVAEPLELIDWIILTREAEMLGTASSVTAVRASIDDQTQIAELARRFRVKPDRVLQALADYQSVVQTALALSGATVPSEAAVLAAIRDTMERVEIKAVMLPAEVFVDDTVEFSEAEVVAQYEKHREREAGTGLTFGYYVPDMLKVQYVKIDRNKLAETVRVPNLQKKAKKLYDEQHERNSAFRRPAEEFVAYEAANTEGPTAERPSPYLSWEEGKDKAIELARQAEATEAAGRMADWIATSVTASWLDAVRGKSGYRPAPESVRAADYYTTTVIENLPSSLKYPDAVSVVTTDLFAHTDAASVPDIGTAYYVDARAGRVFNVGDLAFRSEPVVAKVPDDRGVRSDDYLSLFQTSRYVLRDGKSNVYVFRVVDSRAAHIPESLAEVRDQVVSDLRLKKGYADALRHVTTLQSSDASESLLEAYENNVALAERIDAYKGYGAGFVEPPPVARASQIDAAAGTIGDTINVGQNVGAVPTEVVESWFSTPLVEGEKTIVEMPDRAVAMVLERHAVTRTKPEELDAERQNITDFIMQLRSNDLMREWFKPDNIRARNGFQLLAG